MSRRILILAAGVGSGHNSAARSIELAFAGGTDEVRRLDVLDTTNEVFNKLYDDAYFTLVDQVPWLVGWGYDNQDPPFKLAPVMRWWEQANTIPVVREIREHRPDLVVCTHFLPARLASLMIARGRLAAPLAVVVTDFDFQGLWLTAPVTQLFVAREETRQYLLSLGLPPDRVTTSGIPVRPEFSTPLDADAVRSRYGLNPDVPTLLISAGAAGGPRALQIVRQCLDLTHDFQAVVVCGRNSDLKGEVEALVAGRSEFRVLGFTDEMPALMRVASLFVGKPGGLSSSECMAAGLPMVIVDPIPGQEVRNSDYLLEEGAAVRCNYSTTVGFKIDSLLGDPARIAAMAANARRIGHADAATTVARVTGALPSVPLWISKEARRVIKRISAESGDVATAGERDRLRTLSDPETGLSLALVSEDDLALLGALPHRGTRLQLTRSRLRALRWQPDYHSLATAALWLLGEADAMDVAVT